MGAVYVAPGGIGDVWSEYPVPVPVALPPMPSDRMLGWMRRRPAMQAPLFAEALQRCRRLPSRMALRWICCYPASAGAGSVATAAGIAHLRASPPDPAQLALDLPDSVRAVGVDATFAAGPVERELPRSIPSDESSVAPRPDLPTMRIDNLSDDALLDWLLQAQLPLTEDAAHDAVNPLTTMPPVDRAESTAAEISPPAALPPALRVGTAAEPAAAEIMPVSPVAADAIAVPIAGQTQLPAPDLIVEEASTQVSPVAADLPADPGGAAPVDLTATDVTAFSEDDLLDWLIHQTPEVDPGPNGRRTITPPVSATADLQALDSAAIADLTADDLLDWLTVAAPLEAESADNATIAGANGTDFAHNRGEVSYNHRVLTGEVGYNHSAPDGVPDWLHQRPPGASDSD